MLHQCGGSYGEGEKVRRFRVMICREEYWDELYI